MRRTTPPDDAMADRGPAATGSDHDETLAGLLERAARTAKGVRFLDRTESDRFFAYAELLDRASAAAAALSGHGVRAGDRIAIILPTGPEFYDVFFGASLLGAVPAPLYPPLRLGRLDEYLGRTARLLAGCRARLIVADRQISRLIGRSAIEARPPLGLVDVASLLGGHRGGDRIGDLPSVARDPLAAALIQHSSGTTGDPRPVRLTHRAVLDNVRAIRERLLAAHPDDGGDEPSAVSWLPLYHDMGLIGCVLTAMAHPADLTLIGPETFIARPAIWLRTISRYRATVSGGPDFAYAYCTDRIRDEELEGVDLSSWLVALDGAESVSPQSLDRFARRFGRIGFRREALTPVYGLAEATLAVTFSDPTAPFRVIEVDERTLARDGLARAVAGGTPLVGLGRPIDGACVRIQPEGRPGQASLADGVVGRVQVGGRCMMAGYDDAPSMEGAAGEAPPDLATDAVRAPATEWFDTGDLGFTLDGDLFLCGRAKDVLILRGCKYAPPHIEAALVGVEGIRPGCVAAVGVPFRDGRAERLVVLAERARGADRGRDTELSERARRRIASATGLPCELEILEPGTLPRTSSGKIRRSEARRRYLEGTLDPPARADALSILRETARSGIALARLRLASSGLRLPPRGDSE